MDFLSDILSSIGSLIGPLVSALLKLIAFLLSLGAAGIVIIIIIILAIFWFLDWLLNDGQIWEWIKKIFKELRKVIREKLKEGGGTKTDDPPPPPRDKKRYCIPSKEILIEMASRRTSIKPGDPDEGKKKWDDATVWAFCAQTDCNTDVAECDHKTYAEFIKENPLAAKGLNDTWGGAVCRCATEEQVFAMTGVPPGFPKEPDRK